ncbi:MAG: LysR family transcriptional regulator [Myxococcota bacterium]
MDWLNYHHLYYFWQIARHGSIASAARELRLSPPTLSTQLKHLETSLGCKLFIRKGGRLTLSESGRTTLRYAEEIFSLGEALKSAAKGGEVVAPIRVGVSDLMPKLVLHRLLQPLLGKNVGYRLVCHEDKTDRLLAELSLHHLDMVLAERPIAGQASVRAFNHLLGESTISLFGKDALEGDIRAILMAAPLLVPTSNTLLRRALDRHFDKLGVAPTIAAEFEDSALMKAFGSEGAGVFPGPTAIADDICETYGVQALLEVPEITERFYAITIERRIKHPGVKHLYEVATSRFFS